MSESDLIVPDIQPLTARKILLKTCAFYGYGIGTYGGKTVQVETFYENGKRIAQHLRYPDKEFIWIGESKKVGFWGEHLFQKGGRTLIVTEGAIDAMSIAQITDLKTPVVSIPSGSKTALSCFKRRLEWVNSFDKVILAFDNDEPGQEALHQVAAILPVGKAFTLDMGTFKDANEMLKAGEGARLTKAVYEPREYRPDGIVAGGDLWDALNEETAPGLSLPYPILNEKLQGLRSAQLIMVTAGSGIGKSTFVREVGYHLLMNHKQTIGVLALEENKRKTAKYWVGLHLSKLIHVNINAVSITERRRGFEEVLNNGRFYLYDHWGSTAVDTLLSKINYMRVALGCTFVILDHISIVVSDDNEIGDSERKTIDRLMTRLRTLVNATGVGILAIVHLKRPPGGESYNVGKEVSLSDLRGSGSLEQLSDVVIALERDQQGENQNIALLRLLKDRDLGNTGVADSLLFNPMTGRMYPYQGEIKGAFKKPKGKKSKENFTINNEEPNPDF